MMSSTHSQVVLGKFCVCVCVCVYGDCVRMNRGMGMMKQGMINANRLKGMQEVFALVF